MEISIMESAKFRFTKESSREAKREGKYLGGGTMRDVYESDGLVFKYNGSNGEEENLHYCNRSESANLREWNLYQEFDEATKSICNKVLDYVEATKVLVVKKCPSVIAYLQENFGIKEYRTEDYKPWELLERFSEELKGFSLPYNKKKIISLLCNKWKLSYIEIGYIRNWGIDVENKKLVLIDWDR